MSLTISSFQHHEAFEEARACLTSVIMSLFTSLLMYRIGIIAYRFWFHPLQSIPGPKMWAISNIPLIYTSDISGTGVRRICDFHRKYGPIVRVGPDSLAIDGSIAWPQVYGRRPEVQYIKAPREFDTEVYESTGLAPQDVHRRQRQHLGYAFTNAAMQEQEDTLSQYIKVLTRRIQEHVDHDKGVDVFRWFSSTTFDIIGDLTLGESFGGLQSSTVNPWLSRMSSVIKADALLRACRNYPLVSFFLVYLYGGDKIEKAQQFKTWVRSKCKNRIDLGDQPRRRQDLTTYMLQSKSSGQPGLSQAEIMAISPLIITAGSETTASAITAFFFYLNQTPRVKQIVLDEIRTVIEDESEITMDGTYKLEYLQATLEETLRVYPPAPATPPRRSPGANIEGIYVPRGTSIYVYNWATFRNHKHFLEPDQFHPERWLRRSHPLYDSRFDNDDHTVFRPFGTGPRNCIGKNLAYLEMKLIATRLLFHFDCELLPGQDSWHDDQKAWVLWEKGPLFVKFSPRSSFP